MKKKYDKAIECLEVHIKQLKNAKPEYVEQMQNGLDVLRKLNKEQTKNAKRK